MGITYFTLGVLSMMGLIFVGLVVVGLVKVFRLEKRAEFIEKRISDDFQFLQRRMEDINQNLHRTIDENHQSHQRHRTEDFKYLEDRITREINDCILESKKYTDKRFDKK